MLKDRLTQSLTFDVLAAMTLIILPARADMMPTVLAPGGSVSPLPDFDDPNLDANLITVAETDFGSGSAPTGVFFNFVSTSPLNPFGASGVVFGYVVAVDTGDVVQVSVAGFSGFQTAVKIATDNGLYVPALDATRSADGDTISFDFAGIPGGSAGSPASESGDLDVYTNAPRYSDPLVTITDANGSTAQFDTLGPAVPEPSSLSLCLLSFCLLFLFRRGRAARL
jgi:hypothetical protein